MDSTSIKIPTYSIGAMNTDAIQIEDTSTIQIQEMVRNTSERLEANFSKLGTMIHRFRRGLRGINERYIIPSFVSLGPYHHGSPHLQETEEVKHAAAHYFCEKSGHSIEEVYDKILSIVTEARSCYANDAVANFTNSEFAVMMFLDGCYLLHYIKMDTECALLFNRMTMSTGPCMLRDIFLLENQLPWLVLESLMEFWSPFPMHRFIVGMARSFSITTSDSSTRVSVDKLKRYKPSHLLGLLRYYQIGNMTDEEHINYDTCISAYEACVSATSPTDGFVISSYISILAMLMDKEEDVHELRAEHLIRSLFSDYELLVFFKSMARELRLGHRYFITTEKIHNFKRERPVRIAMHRFVYNNFRAIVAVLSIATHPSDGFVISSYISLLAMLMDKEEDVYELRAKHLIRSFFSNHELLVFFKDLALHLRLDHRYFIITAKIEMFKDERPVRIAMHRFVYNNFKTIVAVLSIAGVVAGIFRTLMSLKQHQP
ncbi:hypothetical protein TRIUR3_27283 [Triticum urartu]|uniref:Uncharacterized protein n=2 Tax=Triticum urartu TaxID=4572 RepID=M7YKS7_TRIUA|nr:hypothetical protein TRIUR3_27283 [Triticum urartu]